MAFDKTQPGVKYPDLVSVSARRSFPPIRCCRKASGTPDGLAGKPQNGDCTSVAAYEDCRIRGPRHRQFPDRAVRAGRLAPGPGQRDQAEVRAAARVELRAGLQ